MFQKLFRSVEQALRKNESPHSNPLVETPYEQSLATATVTSKTSGNKFENNETFAQQASKLVGKAKEYNPQQRPLSYESGKALNKFSAMPKRGAHTSVRIGRCSGCYGSIAEISIPPVSITCVTARGMVT